MFETLNVCHPQFLEFLGVPKCKIWPIFWDKSSEKRVPFLAKITLEKWVWVLRLVLYTPCPNQIWLTHFIHSFFLFVCRWSTLVCEYMTKPLLITKSIAIHKGHSSLTFDLLILCTLKRIDLQFAVYTNSCNHRLFYHCILWILLNSSASDGVIKCK